MALLKRFRGWRWPFIAGGLLVLVIALVGMRLHGGETNAQGDLADHIVITMVAGSFYLAGVATFLRLEAPAEAGSAYGVFLCAALVFCLLNQSTVHENVIAMSLLAVIAHGLATTFACQLLFPTGWSIRGVRLLPALPFVLSCALCGISLPLLVVAPAPWMVTTLLVYIFPVVCMVVITGSIFAGLRRASESRRSVHGMALLGIVLVLLSLAIIAAKSTPFDIVYQPATVGFLLFYAFFAAAMALGSGIFFWAWGRLTLRLLRLLAPVAFVGLGIALAFSVKHFSNFSMTFLRDSLQNLFTYHLFSLPLLILPIICCYALVYRQLSEKSGLLDRHFIRGTLWFILASCFVATEMIASALAIQFWDAHAEITLACVSWLFLSCWLFPLLWSKVRAVGDSMFYRDFYHYNRTLRDLSLALTRLRDLDQICAFLLPRLTTLLNAGGAALLVWQDTKEFPQEWQSYQYEAIAGSMRGFKEAARYAGECLSGQHDRPQLIDGILVLALYDEKRLRGWLGLAEKVNKEAYSRQDQSFLETLAAQLAVLEANTRYLAQVRMHAQQVTALNRRILRAQEDERHRLALELHDDVLQRSMLLTRQVTDLGEGPGMERTLSLARSISSSLRATCLELRPPLLDELGLTEALRWLAQQTEQQSGIRVVFQAYMPPDGSWQQPSAEVALTLYRVGQEALTNVVKHAEARLVRVRLRIDAQGAIALLIADNGRGLGMKRVGTGSLGLTGMRERMQAIGGRLALRSSPGRGVIVRAQYCPGNEESEGDGSHG